MHIRDKEIKRILKYARGLGIKVQFVPGYRGCGGADWGWNPPVITIYKPQKSKTGLIFNLLHELGHHFDWIYNDKLIKKNVIEAYKKLNEGGVFVGPRPDISKRLRKIILKEERAAIEYMEILWKELDLKIPYWKLKLAQYLDYFEYEFFYKMGRFTTTKEFRKIKKAAKIKIKRKYK